MPNALILSRGIVFHEYAIVDESEELCTLRASEKEISAVLFLFDFVSSLAKDHPRAPFPFVLVIKDNQLSSLCGPQQDNPAKWGEIMEGPAPMVNCLFDPLLRVFQKAQHRQKNSAFGTSC